MMATVKLEPLTLAMKEKRQIVAYVVIFAAVDHWRLGEEEVSLDGFGPAGMDHVRVIRIVGRYGVYARSVVGCW